MPEKLINQVSSRKNPKKIQLNNSKNTKNHRKKKPSRITLSHATVIPSNRRTVSILQYHRKDLEPSSTILRLTPHNTIILRKVIRHQPTQVVACTEMLSPNHPNLDPNRRLSTSFSPPHSSDRMGYDSRSGARTECTRGSITCWMSDAASREPDRLDLSTISWREAERSSIDWPGRKPSRDWNRFINRHRPSTPSPAPALSPSPRRARAIPYSFHPPSLPLARIRRCVDYAGGWILFEEERCSSWEEIIKEFGFRVFGDFFYLLER